MSSTPRLRKASSAAIDIGSNSLLLTVVDGAGTVLHDEARIVGLGRGLGDRGAFAPDRLAAADQVLRDFVATAKAHGVEPWTIKAVGTSACRRAMNAETWLQKVQRDVGLRVRIVTGEEEAHLTWLGALRGLQPEGPVLVVDLGGGSTELVLGEGERVLERRSLELGTVRLTEATLCGKGGEVPDRFDPGGMAQLRKRVDVELERVRLDPLPRTVVGTAGTVTTLAATKLGLERYVAATVHGSVLERVDLARFADRLLAADAAGRRALAAVSPERADWLLAGAVILDRVLAAARRPALVASDGGLRFGLLA